MRGSSLPLGAFAAVSVMAMAPAANAQSVQLKSTPMASGLQYPLCVTHAPGDRSRLFVVEQRGRIRVIDLAANGQGTLRPTPLVDLTPQLTSVSLEFGALGLAFHPNFLENGYFYVVCTPTGATTADWALLRFRISAGDRNVADPASQQTVLRFSYTLANHRAGWTAFGPDGYLYANTGDGGENDPLNAAANLSLLRGKVLRLDVDGPDDVPGNADDDEFPADPLRNYTIPPSNPFVSTAGASPEIWAYGLRNPWRASFDRLTGDLWIGDVGQAAREEIDFQPANSPGGENYGWRCMEGLLPTDYAGCTPPLPPSVPPLLDIPRTGAVVTSNSITCGYVYRGCAIPSLRGTFLFGDWTGKVWTGLKVGPNLTGLVSRQTELIPAGQTSIGSIVSFGEDALGELYFTVWASTTGAVYRIDPRTFDGPDCNANSRPDACDIAVGSSRDTNFDGVPDECQPPMCAADFNGAGGLSVQDLFDFLAAYFAADPRADFNHIGGISLDDVFAYLVAYFTGC